MKTNLVTLLMVAATLGGIASGLARTKDSAPAPGANPASPATSGPTTQFVGTVFDFGKVTSGEVVRHDFVFTNIGTTRLEIKDVRPIKSNHPKFPLITVPVIQLQLSTVPVGTQSGSSRVRFVPAKAAAPVAGK